MKNTFAALALTTIVSMTSGCGVLMDAALDAALAPSHEDDCSCTNVVVVEQPRCNRNPVVVSQPTVVVYGRRR